MWRHPIPLLTLLLSPAAAEAQLPAGPPPLVEDVAGIRLRVDPRLFWVMAALEAAEFQLGNNPLPVDSGRAALRKEAGEIDALLLRPLIERLQGREVSRIHTQLTSLALALGPPPELQLPEDLESLPEEVRALAGLQPVLPAFYTASGGEQLWERHRPAWQAEAERYAAPVRQLTTATLEYLRISTRIPLHRRLVILPDLFNDHGTAQARNLGNLYYLVLGPWTGSPAQVLALRHEYLHYLLDPLILKHGMRVIEKKALLRLVKRQPRLESRYEQDIFLAVTESLLSALELRMTEARDPEGRRHRLHESYQQGQVLVFYFDAALAGFESSPERSFPEVLPDLLEGISVKTEESRARVLEKERQKLAAAAQAADLRLRRALQLEAANEALRGRDFRNARRLLEELLREDPENPGALFGLAQVEARESGPDSALSLFEKASAVPESPSWIRAWSLVYSARVLLMRGQLGAARERLERARLIKESRGAAEAAQQELQRLQVIPDAEVREASLKEIRWAAYYETASPETQRHAQTGRAAAATAPRKRP